MRLCRFDDDRLGVVLDDEVADVTEALESLPAVRWPLPSGDPVIAALPQICKHARAVLAHARRIALSEVQLLSPVANPSKIIAAPVNYAKHVAEARADRGINFGSDIKTIDHYGLFLKSNTSLIGPGEPVLLPPLDRRFDHEIELGVVIGREGKDLEEHEALVHVAGYAVALDMTVRGPEDRSWRKSFDTFSVLGPCLVTRDEIEDPDRLDLSLSVNGEVRQRSNTSALIFSVRKLIAYASRAYRLFPGDIIMTGTPEGVGPVLPGDLMQCEVEGVGQMQVRVSAHP
jgi:2-keto-4-pentenoate hydratase/2-oxohepta-3-ene-1,7-dioic acid hydratase in catechol pathway